LFLLPGVRSTFATLFLLLVAPFHGLTRSRFIPTGVPSLGSFSAQRPGDLALLSAAFQRGRLRDSAPSLLTFQQMLGFLHVPGIFVTQNSDTLFRSLFA